MLDIKNCPLVSVHMLTYNHEKYIGDAIDSILAQTYENIEICIGDDASTDETSEILRSYKKRYPEKIKLTINEKNIGLTENCNVVLKMCSGEFLVFFSGDDLMEPKKIEKQVSFMLKNPSCAICYHDMYYIDGFNNKKGNAFSSYHPPKRGKLDIFLKSAPFSFTTSIMIKSADMPEHGFLKEFPVWSDRLMLIEVLEKGGEIDYIDEVLGSYRTHGSNISTIRDSNKFAEYLASLAWTLGKHPQYVRNFKYKTSMAFFLNRKMNSCRDYSVYLRAALGIRFFWKSVVGLLVYYISFKKITL